MTGATYIELNCQREAGGFLYEKNQIKQKNTGDIFTRKLFRELNEKNANAATSQIEYMIKGKKYKVISHYVGEKNLSAVLSENAKKKAFMEMGL